jgi:hypothetical protein
MSSMKERAADAVTEDLRQFAAELASDSPPHPVIAARLAKFAARLEAYPSTVAGHEKIVAHGLGRTRQEGFSR